MAEIPLAPLERLMKKNGADRVSMSACEELRDVLEEVTADVTRKAIKLAAHANRKTVTREDIKLARL